MAEEALPASTLAEATLRVATPAGDFTAPATGAAPALADTDLDRVVETRHSGNGDRKVVITASKPAIQVAAPTPRGPALEQGAG
jgi:hypothetical protein